VQRDDGALQGVGEFLVPPLPVGGAADSEVVLDRAVSADRDDRQRRGLRRPGRERQVDAVAGQVGAEPVAEQVVGDAGE
jgi:hypothetical protein